MPQMAGAPPLENQIAVVDDEQCFFFNQNNDVFFLTVTIFFLRSNRI
jgi:hypothetical protein